MKKILLLPLSLLFFSSLGAQGDLGPEEIIERFAARESEFRELWQQYTYTQNIVFQVLDRSGNSPAFAPRHLLNFWTDVEFGNDVGIGGGMRYVGSQFVSEENLSKVDGVVTFDAMFTYNPVNWGWRLSFKNLTNRKYETRGFGSFSVIPANPFAVYGSIALRL